MSKKPNITYLIGAGASAPDLPITKQLPERIDLLDPWLQTNYPLASDPFPPEERLSGTWAETQSHFLINLQWMKLHASQHYSIDTFAKKLYIDDNQMLHVLKSTLATYFYLEQLRCKLHQRYDTFFAAILSGIRPSIELPANMSILTWNYDSQFEIGFTRYTRQWEYMNSQMQCLPLPPRANPFDPEKFSLIHLNGAAGFNSTESGFTRIFEGLTLPVTIDTVSHALLFYAKYIQQPHSFEPEINFAWETDNPLSQNQLQAALQVAPRTDILVVIGYSFPQFNRAIDRQIIGTMKNLRSVYLQGPENDLPAQKAKIYSMLRTQFVDIPIIFRTDLDQFVIPEEF